MKYLLSALILSLMTPVMVQAAAGISPNGVCETFQEGAVPAEYKPVPSCDQVKSRSQGTSLVERLRAKFQARMNTLHTENQTSPREEKVPAKYFRTGRASILQTAPAIASITPKDESSLHTRTITRPDYSSRYRTYNHRNGERQDVVLQPPRQAYQRPGYLTRKVTAQADDPYSDIPRWTPSSTKNHFREKNYGTNPYSLSSVRSAEQRAYREKRAAEQKVDVKGRALSKSRRWRPDRIIGDLGGNSDWAIEQQKLKKQLESSLEDTE